MSNVPANLRYAKSHEWLKLESDGTATVGITDYAQSSLGDITYVQLPKVGATLKAGEVFGVVESVKAASDLYLPVAGTVVATNAALGRQRRSDFRAANQPRRPRTSGMEMLPPVHDTSWARRKSRRDNSTPARM